MPHIFTINGAEMSEQHYYTSLTTVNLYQINSGGNNHHQQQQQHQYQRDHDLNNTSTTIMSNTNTQKDTSIMAVRKLPKKRKFDPSELEEMGKLSSDMHEPQQTMHVTTTRTKSPNPIPVSVVHPQVSNNVNVQQQQQQQQQQQNFVIVPPQSAAVDYSLRETIDCNVASQIVHQKFLDEPQTMQSIPDMGNCLSVINSNRKHSILSTNPNSGARSGSDISIDLNEWRDHRVLAKQNSFYLPGVIRKASLLGEVWVELDYYEGKQIKFSNVLSIGKYDVIGDASPSMGQLTLGCRVCVRDMAVIDHVNSSVFVEGVVCSILNNPTRFVVSVIGDQHSSEITVKRADLRLMQPPWWDELADLNNEPNPNTIQVSINGQNYVDDNSYNSVMQPGMLHDSPGMPLQLHQQGIK